MKSNELIKIGSNILKKNNIKSYVLDSELILSSISGQLRENFLLNSDFKLLPAQIKLFNNLINRRALGKEPVAYLLNKKEFWSMNFDIDKGVLIPRPETEILVDTLVKYFKNFLQIHVCHLAGRQARNARHLCLANGQQKMPPPPQQEFLASISTGQK